MRSSNFKNPNNNIWVSDQPLRSVNGSSRGSSIFKASFTPAILKPLVMESGEFCKWSYNPKSHLAWIRLITKTFKGTWISQTFLPSSSSFEICSSYQYFNLPFINCLAWVTVKSKGWNWSVMLLGTCTILRLFCSRTWVTFLVTWPLKTWNISMTFWCTGNINLTHLSLVQRMETWSFANDKF